MCGGGTTTGTRHDDDAVAFGHDAGDGGVGEAGGLVTGEGYGMGYVTRVVLERMVRSGCHLGHKPVWALSGSRCDGNTTGRTGATADGTTDPVVNQGRARLNPAPRRT